MTTPSSVWFSALFLQNDTADCDNFEPTPEEQAKTNRYALAINILVFFTVWGISSVVDAEEFKKSFRKPPIYAGVAFQFFLMPFIGFVTVAIFPLEPLQAVTLLILCASPGGSFSNWWCNLFNADLALSVSMTSLSTVASVGMLPLNVLIYVQLAFNAITEDTEEVDDFEVDFADLGKTLGIVIAGIVLGLFTGIKFPQLQKKANFIGNTAGMASILLGVFASADTCDGVPPWQQPFYPLWVATAFPLFAALIGVLILGSLLRLEKPQRVAIALETAYQNSSIALAYAINQGVAGRRAAGIPVIYGGYEAGFFGIFMVTSWLLNWTYCPRNTNICKVMFDNWQPGSDNHKRLHPELYTAEQLKDVEGVDKASEIEEAKVLEVEEGKAAKVDSDEPLAEVKAEKKKTSINKDDTDSSSQDGGEPEVPLEKVDADTNEALPPKKSSVGDKDSDETSKDLKSPQITSEGGETNVSL